MTDITSPLDKERAKYQTVELYKNTITCANIIEVTYNCIKSILGNDISNKIDNEQITKDVLLGLIGATLNQELVNRS